MSTSPQQKHCNWLNVILAIAIICLSICGGAYYWVSHVSVSSEVAPPLPPRETGLSTLNRRTRLDTVFASTIRVKEHQLPLFMRLAGQTDALECRFGNGEVRLGRLFADSVQPIQTAPLPETIEKLTIIKSPGCLEVFCDGIRLLGATVQRQNWRCLEWLTAAETTSQKPEISYQKIGSLFFSDNFMHGEGEMGEWKSVTGTWSVHALKTPVRSANPFSFMGKGENALATTGFWFWRNYRLSCALQPLEESGFALRINCFDDKFDELKWDSATKTLFLHGNDADASIPLPLQQNKWYHVSIASINGYLLAEIDGKPLLSLCETSPIQGGQIGLVANGTVIFDDVVVEQTDSLAIQRIANDTASPVDVVKENDGRHIVFYNLDMSDCELSSTLKLSPGSKATMTLRESISDSLQLVLQRKSDGSQSMKLEMATPTNRKIFAELTDIPDDSLEMTLRAIGRDATVVCNGKTIAIARLPRTWSGGASIVLTPEPGTSEMPEISSISFNAAPPLPEISTQIATFSSERSMQNWNDPLREWLPTSNGEEFWHRSDFWSDIALTMNTSMLGNLTEYGLELGTTTSSNLPTAPYAKITYNKNTQKLTFICDETNASLDVKPAACKTLGLERRADRILARLNGNLAWNLPATKFAKLVLAGRIGKGNTKTWAEAVNIRAGGVHIDIFDKAPTDWIPAAGNWEVTNRWQCDPRWSFFSGVNPDGPACLWSKYTHRDNITLEYFMGPKMDRSRGNNEDKYAADHNLVIAADGKDISSGYSIMLGGWNNRGTQVVRQKKILADNNKAIIEKSGIHHRWYYMKVRKQGGTITVWLDGKLAANVTDPNPLTGNRFALWTWKNGIMVAQHRFSTDETNVINPTETPSKKPPATPYD